VPGANWRHPQGSNHSLAGLSRHPVVHVAYEDVEAYAKWAGKSLPSEAEWEYAARGGLDGANFSWGNEEFPDGKAMVNAWQGEFPWQNTLTDGYDGTSPVGSFPPNGYGLCDMAGNVWEWTSDWYEPRGADPTVKSCCAPSVNPRVFSPEKSYNQHQPQFRIPRKVVKGGSHLCARNYCFRYRPAARQPQMIDTGMAHIGFRCIARTQ
jgi:sulfatase modifying factor 1